MPSTSPLPYLRLARLPGVGPIIAQRLLTALGSADAILNAHPATLAAIDGLGKKSASAISAAAPATLDPARRELDCARAQNITILPLDDPRYPAPLRAIHDPPLLLYVRGELSAVDAIAIGIVGARQCTLYGREMAARFGRELADAGVTVVSGGARGIDTAAHEGAILAKGRTLVIQGCGLLHTYPPENARLYDRIAAEGFGAILSDFPLDTPPLKENFPPRNRIIAGLSQGILVVEANLRSGSLITARLAADDYNREVFAIPGRIDSPASAGTHHLLKNHTAHLVESVDDILSHLGDLGQALRPQPLNAPTESDEPQPPSLFETPPTSAACVPAPLTLTPTQQKILTALTATPITIDDLLNATALPPNILMTELTTLQLQNQITRTSNNRFSRKKP